MTTTLTRSYDILNRTFEYDELCDIAQYGADTGISGFTYYHEIDDVFKKYETIIMDYLQDFADSCFDKSAEAMLVDGIGDEHWTMSTLRTKAVWAYLELRAQEITGQ